MKTVRVLLECLGNVLKACMELKKHGGEVLRLLKDYEPDTDLVKREKISYTGSVKDFVQMILPILTDPRFRVNGQRNREAMIRVLDEVIEVHPDGCPEPRSFRSILSAAQEECDKMHE